MSERFKPYKETRTHVYFRTSPSTVVRQHKILRGKCQMCGKTDAEVSPHLIRVCTRCLSKFTPDTRIVSIASFDFCEICGRYVGVLYVINPFLCEDCAKKIRTRHWQFDYDKKKYIMRKYPKVFYSSPL